MPRVFPTTSNDVHPGGLSTRRTAVRHVSASAGAAGGRRKCGGGIARFAFFFFKSRAASRTRRRRTRTTRRTARMGPAAAADDRERAPRARARGREDGSLGRDQRGDGGHRASHGDAPGEGEGAGGSGEVSARAGEARPPPSEHKYVFKQRRATTSATRAGAAVPGTRTSTGCIFQGRPVKSRSASFSVVLGPPGGCRRHSRGRRGPRRSRGACAT